MSANLLARVYICEIKQIFRAWATKKHNSSLWDEKWIDKISLWCSKNNPSCRVLQFFMEELQYLSQESVQVDTQKIILHQDLQISERELP